MSNSPDDITRLIHRWQSGDPVALDQLLPHVYTELRAMAASSLARQGPSTLQPTALVHDVLLRFLGTSTLHFDDRRDLFKVSARVMRNLLIDRARRNKSEKYGGQLERVDLIDAMQLPIPRDTDLEQLDVALDDLEVVDPKLARIVELRYFVGLKTHEVAAVLGVDERTVYRDWALARLWLREQLES